MQTSKLTATGGKGSAREYEEVFDRNGRLLIRESNEVLRKKNDPLDRT